MGPRMKREDIYNSWLKATARANNRPYRLRSDFGSLKEEDSAALDKLGRMFGSFPGVDVDLFFTAGYHLHGERFIPLSSFSRPSAIRDYKIFIENRKDENVSLTEDKATMDRVMMGFIYIKDLCIKNGWRLSEYIASTDLIGGLTYHWVVDFAEHHICEYNLVAFDRMGFDVSNAIRKTVPDSEIDIFFPGGIEKCITSKIDKMSDHDLELLVSILKKINCIIRKNTVDSTSGSDVQCGHNEDL